jgi:hypothetical protein
VNFLEGKVINKLTLRSIGWFNWTGILFFSVSLLLFCGTAFASQVTLTWNAPTTNSDGTPITYFKGDYRIYYGTSSGNYTDEKSIKNANSIVTYQVSNLTEGQTYYFVVTAVNTVGNESGYSNEAAKQATVPPVPVLNLITPNGGEAIGAGSEYPITWAAAGAVSFKIKYSMDNGLNWTMLGQVENIDTYNWQVPAVTKNKKNCLIKIIGYDALGKRVVTQKSAAPFTIETMKLITPNGSETVQTNLEYDILWEIKTTAAVSKVKIFLNVDGSGMTWQPIAELDGNPGYYRWTPEVAKTKNNCLIKIVAYDASGKQVGRDFSDDYFVIIKN